nr:MAG TPA: hypothetical protein [Caudoviricetes sp.]
MYLSFFLPSPPSLLTSLSYQKFSHLSRVFLKKDIFIFLIVLLKININSNLE